ncbi:MAG TPA: Rne/Rng family ribonuclease [Kineosporiaceae bacterium]|nr:Rne/Rng family ribonuclease [Kineosporiaceae bacterium]
MTLDDESTQTPASVSEPVSEPASGPTSQTTSEPAPDPAPDPAPGATPAARSGARRRVASRPAGPPAVEAGPDGDGAGQEPQPAAAPRKRASRKKAAVPPPTASWQAAPEEEPAPQPGDAPLPAEGTEQAAAAPSPAHRRRARATAEPVQAPSAESAAMVQPVAEARAAEPSIAEPSAPTEPPSTATPTSPDGADSAVAADAPAAPGVAMPIFQAPAPARPRRRAASRPAGPPQHVSEPSPAAAGTVDDLAEQAVDAEPDDDETPELAAAEADLELDAGVDENDADEDEGEEDEGEEDEGEETGPEAGRRRRRRRGGRGRRGRAGRDQDSADEVAPGEAGEPDEEPGAVADTDEDEADEEEETGGSTSRRRRRRRRRASGGGPEEPAPDDPPNTVVRVRESRRAAGGGEVSSLRGSTRLEAKKVRRREGREAGRRRPLITEAEFLARRESVDRVMVVRERDGRTQIGVLEDGVLVEHYVARRTQTTMVGNVYLGRVQNVLPSMEAAFVDIGKGRNAVLYAGEVNWDAAGLEGQPKRIEHALKAGEAVLVQVTKDPIGHKGARLTSQISLPGRYLVYVPDGSMTGISRKLPDTERARLKKVLRDVVPDDAGVIVRTAAEGASEEELQRDVARLQAQWDDISRKAGAVNAPNLLYGEPDLAIRVVRDIFNEDFGKLVVSGDEVYDTLESYLGHVAPDLVGRLERWHGEGDVFTPYRIDEQIAKAVERKVWLPSGGSLVIDRTEAMTVIDVNTGKFTGAGGNLEETVTKNNLEAAEEIVRQLRLRDIGGIIVVDFIDMVLESNRDLVLRRLLECLGRDRTKHQVAEVTSLGLVQMTRKRVGQGLLEVFSETCECCGGRGIIVHDEPVERRPGGEAGRGRSGSQGHAGQANGPARGAANGDSSDASSGSAVSGPAVSGPAVSGSSEAGAAGNVPAETGGSRTRRRRGGGRSAAVAEGA